MFFFRLRTTMIYYDKSPFLSGFIFVQSQLFYGVLNVFLHFIFGLKDFSMRSVAIAWPGTVSLFISLNYKIIFKPGYTIIFFIQRLNNKKGCFCLSEHPAPPCREFVKTGSVSIPGQSMHIAPRIEVNGCSGGVVGHSAGKEHD